MNLKQLASHTVDLDILPDAPGPVVLDVGCRWFDFTAAIIAERPAAHVLAFDPARDVARAFHDDRRWHDPHGPHVSFWDVALVGMGDVGKKQRLAHFSTGEGDFITTLPRYHDAEMYEVSVMPIVELTRWQRVQHFDLVKLDCEGSEFGILENWPGPIATQISVEFHDWDKPQYRTDSYYDALWRKLPWYRVVQHELSKQGEGTGHWDTLLVLDAIR